MIEFEKFMNEKCRDLKEYVRLYLFPSYLRAPLQIQKGNFLKLLLSLPTL